MCTHMTWFSWCLSGTSSQSSFGSCSPYLLAQPGIRRLKCAPAADLRSGGEGKGPQAPGSEVVSESPLLKSLLQPPETCCFSVFIIIWEWGEVIYFRDSFYKIIRNVNKDFPSQVQRKGWVIHTPLCFSLTLFSSILLPFCRSSSFGIDNQAIELKCLFSVAWALAKYILLCMHVYFNSLNQFCIHNLFCFFIHTMFLGSCQKLWITISLSPKCCITPQATNFAFPFPSDTHPSFFHLLSLCTSLWWKPHTCFFVGLGEKCLVTSIQGWNCWAIIRYVYIKFDFILPENLQESYIPPYSHQQ